MFVISISFNLFKTSSWYNSWDYYSENSIEDYVPTLEECNNFKMSFETFMISIDNFYNNSIDDYVETSTEYLKTSLITTLDIVCVNEDKPLYGIQILYYPPNKTYPIGYIRNHKLNELKEIYDYVIVDTPPVGLLSDALVLMKQSDVNIFVMKAGVSKRDFIDIAHQLVEKNEIKHMSIVLNGVSSKNIPSGYGAGYYS